jgi:hypothetical protein
MSWINYAFMFILFDGRKECHYFWEALSSIFLYLFTNHLRMFILNSSQEDEVNIWEVMLT